MSQLGPSAPGRTVQVGRYGACRGRSRSRSATGTGRHASATLPCLTWAGPCGRVNPNWPHGSTASPCGHDACGAPGPTRQLAEEPAEYLLMLPRVRARVPTSRTASYGHQVADRLQGLCSLCRNAAVRLGLSGTGSQSARRFGFGWCGWRGAVTAASSTEAPDNMPESHTATRPFPGPHQESLPDVPDNRPLSDRSAGRSLFLELEQQLALMIHAGGWLARDGG